MTSTDHYLSLIALRLGAQPRNCGVAGQHFGTVSLNGSTQTQNFSLVDWLGSERARTSVATGIPTSSYESQPFGDAQTILFGSDTDAVHFTGKERDAESGNDYFGARYYASNMGRFMSPDWSAKAEPVPYSKLDNPQSLNLYAYALNNPLSNVDVDGHETEAEKQAAIAAAAKAQNGSTSYNINTTNVSNMQIFKPGSDKCNEFVTDTVKSADGTRPLSMEQARYRLQLSSPIRM